MLVRELNDMLVRELNDMLVEFLDHGQLAKTYTDGHKFPFPLLMRIMRIFKTEVFVAGQYFLGV